MTTYGYSRVSTMRQADEGESLEVQQRMITGYALMHGLELDRLFVERGISGSTPLSERQLGAELLALVQPGDVIITAKLDRMFRSALDALDVLAKLKARGVSLHMIDLNGDVTGNGISKLVFTILSAVAEAERDRIRERISQVKADQKSRGRYLGGKAPFGFRPTKEGALEAVDGEQSAIHQVHEMRSSGRSMRAIQTALEATGSRLSLAAIHRIVHEA